MAFEVDTRTTEIAAKFRDRLARGRALRVTCRGFGRWRCASPL